MVTISEDIWNFDLEAALAEISEQRREQALKFKHELGQRTCVLAYQLLRQLLREEFGFTDLPVFEYGAHGKPAIIGRPDIHFNLSHCRRAVVCAVSHQPIGIDVESIREYKESLARYTMNDEELQQISSAPRPDEAFVRLWTMKEAALKLIGTGISNDLKPVLTDHPHFHFTTHVAPQYIYTVCDHDYSGRDIRST
ncbi:MAG: 4'-phosphopantetheinyl transferase superfamily protein [Prevotella sp.]|nr:4'-phosphopantetheinyl transferase superfamily protein [Prevotella sp.]